MDAKEKVAEKSIEPMSYGEFMKRRAPFAQAANARREERRNHGDDSPWFVCVLEEIAMALWQENDRLRAEIARIDAGHKEVHQSLRDLAQGVGYVDGVVSKGRK